MPFFGLDIETSARELLMGGRLIQIGAATMPADDDDDPATFSSLVHPGALEWEESAYAVHGIERSSVSSAPSAAQVDGALSAWLIAHGADPARPAENIAVGFNVGSYDLPFIAHTLPKTSALLSYRTADLNSVLFALDGVTYDGAPRNVSEWKALAKAYAARRLAATGQAAHDAGYDSAEAVHIWRFLAAAIRHEPLPLLGDPVPEAVAQTQARAVRAGYSDTQLAAAGLTPVLVELWARGGRATDPARLEALAELYARLPADVRAAHPARAL